MSDAPEFVTLAQASSLIATPSETLRRWIWQGRLKGYKPGRGLLLRRADVLALVEANELGAKRVAGQLRTS